jgi:pimeloyl-ACP methyl ester carboxylesterase
MLATVLVNRQDAWVDVGEGVNLRVSVMSRMKRTAASRALLCVHGLASSRHCFNEFGMKLIQMDQDVSCVATVDLRGHGESHAAPAPFTLDAFASDIDAVLAHLARLEAEVWGSADTVSVLGHSYGANLVLHWATTAATTAPATAPVPAMKRDVKHCILIDGGFIRIGTHFPQGVDACLLALVPPGPSIPSSDLPRVLMQWFPEFSTEAIQGFLCNFTTVSDAGTDMAVLRLAVETHKDLLRDLYLHPPAVSSTATPASASVVLVPTGDSTPFAPDKRADVAALQALGLPSLEVRWLEDQTHLLPMQSPVILAGVVSEVMAT